MRDLAPQERTALILVRAWVPPGSGIIRARLIGVADLLNGSKDEVAASGVEEVCDVIRSWLLSMSADPDQPPS